MVAEASGCCARAVNAVDTDRPSANAGPMHPKLVVIPAVQIEAIAIRVMLSILGPLVCIFCFKFWALPKPLACE